MEKPNSAATNIGRTIFIGALLLIAAAVIVLYAVRVKEQETIKIGAILSLSGPGSHLVDMIDAMQMAVEEVNARGGVNGRNIELLVEDNRTDPAEAEKAFLKLEQTHKPELYVSALSSIGMALKPLAEERQVVLVGLNTTAPEFTERSIWVFRDFFTAADEAKAAVNRLRKLHVRSLGIIYLDDPYGTSMLEALEKRLSGDGSIWRKLACQIEDEDFTQQIEILKSEPAIYLLGFTKHISIMIRQLRQIDYQGIILASSGAANPLVTDMEEAEGVYLAAPIIYNPAYPFVQGFKTAFETRYGKTMSHQAANGYDFIKIVAGLLEGAEISRLSIRGLFEQGFMYSGVMGEQELVAGSQEIIIPLHPAVIHDKIITFH